MTTEAVEFNYRSFIVEDANKDIFRNKLDVLLNTTPFGYIESIEYNVRILGTNITYSALLVLRTETNEEQ